MSRYWVVAYSMYAVIGLTFWLGLGRVDVFVGMLIGWFLGQLSKEGQQ